MATKIPSHKEYCYVTQKQLLSRFLYPNPVCLLSLTDSSTVPAFQNVMTISWLMPIDNQGNIMLSMNATRCTAEKFATLPVGHPFVLNIPNSELQELVLEIGKSSGFNVDKFSNLAIDSCLPGWQSTLNMEVLIPNKPNGKLSKKQISQQERLALVSQTCAITSCIAHLVCTLVCCTDANNVGFRDSNHILISSNISCAYVMNEYWNGRNFVAQSPESSPILSFLGSGVFGHIHPGQQAIARRHGEINEEDNKEI